MSDNTLDYVKKSPKRVWTTMNAGSIVTSSAGLAGEMLALGDRIVEYVRADLNRQTLDALYAAHQYIAVHAPLEDNYAAELLDRIVAAYNASFEGDN